jgi:hypothetical protein
VVKKEKGGMNEDICGGRGRSSTSKMVKPTSQCQKMQ